MPLEPYVSFIDAEGLRGARVGVLAEAWGFTPVDPAVVELAKAADRRVRRARRASVRPGVRSASTCRTTSTREQLAEPVRARRTRSTSTCRATAPSTRSRPRPSCCSTTPACRGGARDREVIEHPVDLDRDPEYRATLEGRAKLREAVVALMDRYGLDALIYPHKLHGPLKIGPRDDPERDYTPNQMSPVDRTAGVHRADGLHATRACPWGSRSWGARGASRR